MKDNIVPHYPIYCQAPNQLLRYEIRPFETGNGIKAHVRVAIFLDKNKKQHEMDAQVLWNYKEE